MNEELKLSEHLYEAADSIEEPLFHQFVSKALALEEENRKLRAANYHLMTICGHVVREMPIDEVSSNWGQEDIDAYLNDRKT